MKEAPPAGAPAIPVERLEVRAYEAAPGERAAEPRPADRAAARISN